MENSQRNITDIDEKQLNLRKQDVFFCVSGQYKKNIVKF